MLDPRDVTTEATKGFVEELARRREISLRRMYEILTTDNPLPKSKRLIRDIEAVNHAGYELVKADMLALFAELDGDASPDVAIAEMSQELHDPLQARLEQRSKAERLSECRQAIVVLAKEISQIEAEGVVPIRREMRDAVELNRARKNGR